MLNRTAVPVKEIRCSPSNVFQTAPTLNPLPSCLPHDPAACSLREVRPSVFWLGSPVGLPVSDRQ